MSGWLVSNLRLEEIVLLEGFVANHRRRSAAAIELEHGADLVERAAELCGNRVRRDDDDELDASRVAALPSLHPELVGTQRFGEVEASPLTDGSETEVE